LVKNVGQVNNRHGFARDHVAQHLVGNQGNRPWDRPRAAMDLASNPMASFMRLAARPVGAHSRSLTSTRSCPRPDPR
jgi:hypothetical protein